MSYKPCQKITTWQAKMFKLPNKLIELSFKVVWCNYHHNCAYKTDLDSLNTHDATVTKISQWRKKQSSDPRKNN